MPTNVLILDIDGCLSDDRWRRRYIPANARSDDDHRQYHSLAFDDKPMNVAAVEAFAGIQNLTLVFLTTRPRLYYHKTRGWLDKHFPAAMRSALIMRAGNENGVSSVAVKKRMLRQLLEGTGDHKLGDCTVVGAYDNREDVLRGYEELGVARSRLVLLDENGARCLPPKTKPCPTSAILEQAAATFAERNAVYQDNYKAVGPIMAALFPDGAPPELLHSDHFHLLELIVVKLTRFARTGSTHKDSMRDIAVYAAMIESILENKQ